MQLRKRSHPHERLFREQVSGEFTAFGDCHTWMINNFHLKTEEPRLTTTSLIGPLFAP